MEGLLEELESFIRSDPAMRGLISSEAKLGRLCPGHFAAAAKSLAEPDLRVAIITGFFVPGANPPAAETDGPPGAVRLALALEALGHRVLLMTDSHCARALQVAAEVMRFPVENVRIYPDSGEMDSAREAHLHEVFAGELTHLISIERAGPSHSAESLKMRWNDEVMLQSFLERVGPADWNHCHNMRGENIDLWTGGLHRLFDWVSEHRPDVKTIGIGDGGNEIGMGCLRWDDVASRLLGEQAFRIPCRVATTWNIIAGISNWGGYALAAAVLALCGRTDVMESWTSKRELEVLEQFVMEAPAVDGITRRPEATVDGLPFLTYIQPWAGIRQRLGLAE